MQPSPKQLWLHDPNQMASGVTGEVHSGTLTSVREALIKTNERLGTQADAISGALNSTSGALREQLELLQSVTLGLESVGKRWQSTNDSIVASQDGLDRRFSAVAERFDHHGNRQLDALNRSLDLIETRFGVLEANVASVSEQQAQILEPVKTTVQELNRQISGIARDSRDGLQRLENLLAAFVDSQSQDIAGALSDAMSKHNADSARSGLGPLSVASGVLLAAGLLLGLSFVGLWAVHGEFSAAIDHVGILIERLRQSGEIRA